MKRSSFTPLELQGMSQRSEANRVTMMVSGAASTLASFSRSRQMSNCARVTLPEQHRTELIPYGRVIPMLTQDVRRISTGRNVNKPNDTCSNGLPGLVVSQCVVMLVQLGVGD